METFKTAIAGFGSQLAAALANKETDQPGTAVMQAEDVADQQQVTMWLHNKGPLTQRAYREDVDRFLWFVAKPLRQVRLADLQPYQNSLDAMSTASQGRKLSSVKSLFKFLQSEGYIVVNPAVNIRLPKIKDTLAQRIMDEESVRDMLALERNPRNRVLLRVLYYGGLRISEACGLRVRDLKPNGDAGQITVMGKGGKTRAILLKASVWRDLALMRGPDPDAPVFRSRQRRPTGPDADRYMMDPSMVHHIVKAAAKRAGLSPEVSAHWLRHAHVSHALDHGAPAHLVQATVGHASLVTTTRYAHVRPTESSSTYLP